MRMDFQAKIQLQQRRRENEKELVTVFVVKKNMTFRALRNDTPVKRILDLQWAFSFKTDKIKCSKTL